MSFDTVGVKLEPLEGPEAAGRPPPAAPAASGSLGTKPEFIEIKMEPDLACSESGAPACPSASPPCSPAGRAGPMELIVSVKEETVEFEPCTPAPAPPTASQKPRPSETCACAVCGKVYVNRGNLLRHVATRHAEGAGAEARADEGAPPPPAPAAPADAACARCGRAFTSAARLRAHVCREKGFQCSTCLTSFGSASSLSRHRWKHTAPGADADRHADADARRDKPHSCAVCHRRFALEANVAKHLERGRCRPPDVLECPVCHKVFLRRFLLRSHLRRHTTERPYECAACAARFKYKSTLARHTQLHEESRPAACAVCGKRFTHAGLVKPHMRKHTGERPYQCALCLRRFSHKHNMERHALRHDKVKHLVCEVCHKAFQKESRLKYHMRTHAADKRPFKCEHCPKCFSHKQNVKRHYARKHPQHTYDRPETDASVASTLWEKVLKARAEKQTDFILPDDAEEGVKVEEGSGGEEEKEERNALSEESESSDRSGTEDE